MYVYYRVVCTCLICFVSFQKSELSSRQTNGLDTEVASTNGLDTEVASTNTTSTKVLSIELEDLKSQLMNKTHHLEQKDEEIKLYKEKYEQSNKQVVSLVSTWTFIF